MTVHSLADKLAAKKAAEQSRNDQFREDLAARGFDPAMADWVLTWREDANGEMIPGSQGIITPEDRGDA